MRARDSFMPLVRNGVDRAAHRLSDVGYGVLPWLVQSWRGVHVERDVPYRDKRRRFHLLDVYRRRDAVGPLPTIMYIHGGAFSMMSKDTHRVMAYLLAAQGYQVFNVNYRLGPIHTYPKPLKDVMIALEWVLDNGAKYGADPDRLAVIGESAGANLTAALAYCATHPRPEPFARSIFERGVHMTCVAPLYGLLDLYDVRRFWRDPDKNDRMPGWVKGEIRGTAYSYLGRRVKRALQFPLASPLLLFEQPPVPGSRPLPPFFTTVGTADPLLPDTIRLSDALERRGIECDLHVFRGEIHAFNVLLWRAAARAQWGALFDFLGKHMRVSSIQAPARAPHYVSLADSLAE
ncbi:MAG TPA: alpha/beta hydrolase [Polyangiales bacterium]|nr:alpha/beta hydrolase [Polyangiales bacterium]